MMRFSETRVLVTGGGNGIGLAIVKAFAREGARVVLADLTAERVAIGRQRAGEGVLGVPGDVRDPAQATGMVEEADRLLGGLDIVVSNAGIYPNHPFLEMTLPEWDHVMGVNARGTFLVCQAAARVMVGSGSPGSIVTISSGSARFARVGAAHYCASKAAVVALTRVMALELAPHRIRVNSVSPGIVDVEGGQQLDEGYRAAMTSMVPWGRMGRPDDIAAAVLLVSDPSAEYLTGQVIPVDGGLSAGRYGIPRSR